MRTPHHPRSPTPQRPPRPTKSTATRGTLLEWKISRCRSSTFHRYASTVAGIHSWKCVFTFNPVVMEYSPTMWNAVQRRIFCFPVTQDLMEFLNANSSECSVVLFFTSWCQFSARLAPHFNALPRVFPSMHFLALDASQHSRWLVTLWPLCCVSLVEAEVGALLTSVYVCRGKMTWNVMNGFWMDHGVFSGTRKKWLDFDEILDSTGALTPGLPGIKAKGIWSWSNRLYYLTSYYWLFIIFIYIYRQSRSF